MVKDETFEAFYKRLKFVLTCSMGLVFYIVAMLAFANIVIDMYEEKPKIAADVPKMVLLENPKKTALKKNNKVIDIQRILLYALPVRKFSLEDDERRSFSKPGNDKIKKIFTQQKIKSDITSKKYNNIRSSSKMSRSNSYQ